MPRLFIAILPTTTEQTVLKSVFKQIKDSLPDLTANWVTDHQLHVNLHFLNEIPATKIPKITELLADIAINYQPFNLTIKKLLGFPDLRHPRVLALGIQNCAALNNLALQIQTELEKENIAPAEERLYRPHLTLARVKVQLRGSERQFLESFKYDGLLWPVTEFALLQSQLTPAGPIHKVIKTFKLAPSDPTIPLTAKSILRTLNLTAEETAA